MTMTPPDPVLLDINVLIALAWPNHQFHAEATRRLQIKGQRWCTCAITQLGFVRLSSTPAVTPAAVSPPAAAALLSEMTNDPLHTYLAKLPAPSASASTFAGILGHKQVTDAYLITIARRHRVTLLTFDSRLCELGNVELLD